jgi:hypothetical protein
MEGGEQVVKIPKASTGGKLKPAIGAIEPASCEIGGRDFTLYVRGDNFSRASVIHFDGRDEYTTLHEHGALSTRIKPAMWLEPQMVEVTVRDGALESRPVLFEFTMLPPRDRQAK